MVTMQPLFSRRSESSLGKDKWTAAPAAASAHSSCGLRRGSSKSRRAVTVKHIPGFRDSVGSDRKQNSSLIFICLQVRMIIYGNIRLNKHY